MSYHNFDIYVSHPVDGYELILSTVELCNLNNILNIIHYD